MAGQTKEPSTLSVEDFQKTAEIYKEGAVLKIHWGPQFGDPEFLIVITMNSDKEWVSEILELSDSSDRFNCVDHHRFLAEAFDHSVNTIVTMINSLRKARHDRILLNNEVGREIDKFLKSRSLSR